MSLKTAPTALAGGLMGALPDDLRAELEHLGSVIRYSDGQTIHQRGDDKPGLSIIISGGVVFSITDINGRSITTARYGIGDSFGEFTLFADLPRTHDATAFGKTTVRQIPKTQFFALLDRQPDLRDHLLKHFTRLLFHAITMLEDERRLSLKVRVAKSLLLFSMRNPQQQTISATQEKLADVFAVSRVAMGTALAQLRDAGLIQTVYGGVKIPDRQKLSAWVIKETGVPPLAQTTLIDDAANTTM